MQLWAQHGINIHILTYKTTKFTESWNQNILASVAMFNSNIVQFPICTKIFHDNIVSDLLQDDRPQNQFVIVSCINSYSILKKLTKLYTNQTILTSDDSSLSMEKAVVRKRERQKDITLKMCYNKTGTFQEPTHYTTGSFHSHQQSTEENTLFRILSIAAISEQIKEVKMKGLESWISISFLKVCWCCVYQNLS